MPFRSISRRLRLTVGATNPDRKRSHPRLEWLEDRTLLSVFTVTDTSDSASDPGSLRRRSMPSTPTRSRMGPIRLCSGAA